MVLNTKLEIMIPYQSDEVCPLCQNNRYLNPNMVLLLSECFHKMCQSCVDSTFKNGNAKCHVCNTTLKKADFEPQMFEDFEVEKEIRIRKKIAKVFNKRRDNFPDLRSYNDYLEMVEEYVMNILYGEEVEKTWATIKKYAEENKELIRMNEIKEADENKNYKRLLDDQKRMKDEGMQESLRLIKEAEEMKRRAENNIISNLANSNKSASEIIDEQIKIKRKSKELSAAEIKAKSMRSRYDPRFDINKNDDEDDSIYVPFEPVYAPVDIELKKRYRDRIVYPALSGKEKIAAAGGYSVQYAYLRAIEAAHMAVNADLLFKEDQA